MNEIEKAIEYFYNQMEIGKIESDYQQAIFEIAISALEKQIPKKPIYKFTDSTGDVFYDCQVCGEYVTHSGTQAKKNFCSNCGQKIDWGVEE